MCRDRNKTNDETLCWVDIDIERWKLGEQMGLDTPSVLVVNNGY